MSEFRVNYSGWYIVEADSPEEAMETCRDDYEVRFEQWENDRVVLLEE